MKCSLSFEATLQRMWHTRVGLIYLFFWYWFGHTWIIYWNYLVAKIKHVVMENKVHLVFLWCGLGDLWSFLLDRISSLFWSCLSFFASVSYFRNHRSQSPDCFHSVLFFNNFQPSQWRASHSGGPDSVMVDKLAMCQVLLLVLWFPTVSIIPPVFHTLSSACWLLQEGKTGEA